MRNFNINLGCLKDRRLSVGIVVLMLIFLGAAFTATDCLGQAVPPRIQSRMLTEPPPVPRPTPPLQKEIGDIRQQVQTNTRELARMREVQKTIAYANIRVQQLEKTLSCFKAAQKMIRKDPSNAGVFLRRREICDLPLPATVKEPRELEIYCGDMIDSIRKDIEALQYSVGGLEGGKKR